MKKQNPTSLKSVSRCTRCPMLGVDHVPSEGNPYADIMFIGQSPGETEVKKGKPFCGPSGELLGFMLDEAGINRTEVYIANALKCHPPGNRPGMKGELEMCWDVWLKKEIKIVDPRIIVILGKDAFMSVMPEDKHNEWGHLNVIKSKKRTYLVVKHPAHFLMQGNMQGFIDVAGTLQELLEDE